MRQIIERKRKVSVSDVLMTLAVINKRGEIIDCLDKKTRASVFSLR